MSDPTEYEDRRNQYGLFGGRYVPEPLWTPLEKVARAYEEARASDAYCEREQNWQRSRLGRPTPLTHLHALSDEVGGAQIWAKREDLLDGSTFCTISALTQALVARRMGKSRLIGESATGDFGVALASMGAALGLEVTIYMRRGALEAEDLNAARMTRLGVELVAVDGSGRGRSQAMAEALRNFSIQWEDTFYATSSLASPAPYPTMVGEALSVIGEESVSQIRDENIDVEYAIAPVGSGSFAAGLFGTDWAEQSPQLIGVQAGGGDEEARTSASLVRGRPGVYLGTRSLVLQDEEGQIIAPHADAPGMAMPIAGPQHARWLQQGRVHYVMVDDQDAIEAQSHLARSEGIFASQETGYAIAYALKLAPTLRPDQHILVGISGAGLRSLGLDDEPEDDGGLG